MQHLLCILMSTELLPMLEHSWGLIGLFVGLLWENESMEWRRLNVGLLCVCGGAALREKLCLVDSKIHRQHLLCNLDTRDVMMSVMALVIFYCWQLSLDMMSFWRRSSGIVMTLNTELPHAVLTGWFGCFWEEFCECCINIQCITCSAWAAILKNWLKFWLWGLTLHLYLPPSHKNDTKLPTCGKLWHLYVHYNQLVEVMFLRRLIVTIWHHI